MGVRVTPRAARAGLAGTRDGRLLVRVTAPPVEGAANEALVAVLAEACGVPRSTVRLEAGGRSREKRVSFPAAAAERLRAMAEA